METESIILFEEDRTVPARFARPFDKSELYASYCDEVLTLDFSFPINSITVTLTHVSSGHTAWWSYSLVGNVSLNLEFSGDYRIQVRTPFWSVVGEFSK